MTNDDMFDWPLSQKVIFLHRMKDLIALHQKMEVDPEVSIMADAMLSSDLNAVLKEYNALGEWV